MCAITACSECARQNLIELKTCLYRLRRRTGLVMSQWPGRYWVRISKHAPTGRKEGNILFNDALNTFYLRLYGVGHMVKDHSDSERGTRCRHICYSFRLATRVILYASSHRQDNTYHDLCYTSRGTLEGRKCFI